MNNVFDKQTIEKIIERIEKLNSESKPNWGKMNAPKMLAHCSAIYDTILDESAPRAKGIKKWLMKKFVKPIVVGPKPYPKNGRTAPEFIINNEREFEKEKTKLIAHIINTQQQGAAHFKELETPNFGHLDESEWNTLFYKHIDHHLNQFGV